MFETLFYQPVLNLLIFLYNIVPGNDLGVASLLLTAVIKLILLPLSKKSLQSQKALQDLQPKIEAIKKKYKDKNNNHPVITACAVVGNPDFEKIKASKFTKYYFESII